MENESIGKEQYEIDYNLLIETLELKLNEQYKNFLRIKGKLLHETNDINILFHLFIYKSTEINPFEAEIEMTAEFIEKETPYIQIMTNFLEPTLYDIKNYFDRTDPELLLQSLELTMLGACDYPPDEHRVELWDPSQVIGLATDEPISSYFDSEDIRYNDQGEILE